MSGIRRQLHLSTKRDHYVCRHVTSNLNVLELALIFSTRIEIDRYL